MKKLLSLLGTITLIGTSTTSLVACNKQYSEDELKKEKEKNNININGNILEWISPQEKTFNTVDDKYYFVIWQHPDSLEFKITKFFNNSLDAFKNNKIIYNYNNYNNYNLVLTQSPNIFRINDLGVKGSFFFKGYFIYNLPRKYFKSVYLWNNDSEPNTDVEDKLKSYLDL